MRAAFARFERRLLALLALTALTLGVIGFGLQHGYRLTFVDRLYYAIQLFTFEYNVRPPDNWPLNVARFLAPAVALYAAALALSSAFRDEIHHLRARTKRQHVVVAGLGTVGRVVARNFRDGGNDVVAIEIDANKTALQQARDEGLIAIQGDAREVSTLDAAGIVRATKLVVVCGSDERNAEVVAAARDIVNRRRDGPLRCVVQIDDFELGTLLAESALAVHSDERLRVEFFNIAERGAHALVDKHPPFEGGETPHLLVVGLGDMGGTAVALAALRWSAQSRGEPLQVTVLDRQASSNVNKLEREYGGIRGACAFEPINVDVRDPAFERGEFLSGRRFTISYVFLSDDSTALTAALALRRLSASRTIVVRTTRHPNLSALLEQAQPDAGLPSLHAFSLVDEVCKTGVLLEGPAETIARAIHQQYLERQRALGAANGRSLLAWEELADLHRESNRQSAEHIAKKLAAIGCAIVRLTDWSQEQAQFTDEEIEIMAELEHERWLDERREKEPGHRSLVPWSELSESERDMDRAIVREIPDLLADVGYAVVRAERVA